MEKIESYLLDNVNEFVGFARKRLNNPELAADAVQESLLKALRAADQIRDEESVKAWFYRILRRTIIDLYRRRDARDRMLAELEQESNSPPDAEEERVVCACIERLLPTMAPQYASLIRQIDLNGETPDAVATDLGISKNNLNVRIHRARQQLKGHLEENCRICAEHGCLDCHCSTRNEPPDRADHCNQTAGRASAGSSKHETEKIKMKSFVLVMATLFSACASYQVPPLSAGHPANPAAASVAVQPNSKTLSYTRADMPSPQPVMAAVAAQQGGHDSHHAEAPKKTVTGEGKVIATVPSANQIVVEHGEIKGFMDAMTMGYRVEPSSLLEGLQPGDKVRFTIDVPNKMIVKIEKMK